AVGNITGSAISFVVLPLGWRWMFLVGILPSLLVVAVFRKMKEPEKWLKARAAVAQGDRKQMGSMKDLWTHPRWRRNTIIGLLLGDSASGLLHAERFLRLFHLLTGTVSNAAPRFRRGVLLQRRPHHCSARALYAGKSDRSL